MSTTWSRLIRWSALALMALGLSLSPGFTTPALAQDEPAEAGGGEKGRSLDGYLATGVLAGLALFAVGKTARR